jgi:hypothetical protein
MKTHPSAAILNILLECFALSRRIWPGVQEENHLAFGKKLQVQALPIIGGLIGEAMFSGHSGEPPVRFFYKADVRFVALAGIKGNDFECWRIRLRHNTDGANANQA